jgi:BirA family biotin operon repressor/biotin-[acetyl-CoA-carboxylase] ligase
MAAFCVANAIKENFGIEPMIKLPNDVYLNGKKICGILTENIIEGEVKASILGIGVNANIENFPKELGGASSILVETGKIIDNNEFLEQIIIHLQKTMSNLKS